MLSLLLSTKTHLCAPLDKHSIPKEPVPANERADEIKEKAEKYKYEMIERSNQYAEDVLSFLEQKLEETLEEVKNNKRELNPRM